MEAIAAFADAMHALFAEEREAARRWQRVGRLLPLLLDDPDLRLRALRWPVTQTADGTAANLLLYEDPTDGWVINALVKAPHAATPVHDHAHTWTAYGVIAGSERVERYAATPSGPLQLDATYDVVPGFVDVVPPGEPHRETSGAEPSVAIIVRSERIGGFDQTMYDVEAGTTTRRPGPTQIPFSLER